MRLFLLTACCTIGNEWHSWPRCLLRQWPIASTLERSEGSQEWSSVGVRSRGRFNLHHAYGARNSFSVAFTSPENFSMDHSGLSFGDRGAANPAGTPIGRANECRNHSMTARSTHTWVIRVSKNLDTFHKGMTIKRQNRPSPNSSASREDRDTKRSDRLPYGGMLLWERLLVAVVPAILDSLPPPQRPIIHKKLW